MTWLIEFYAAWSPQCTQFAPAFSEMSSKYVCFYVTVVDIQGCGLGLETHQRIVLVSGGSEFD